jgi:hypothetical protein
MIWKQVVLSVVACVALASAATITIDSQQGLFTGIPGIETVAITPHPSWEPNHPVNPGDSTDNSAVWISYADTGYGGTQFQPPGAASPVATIFDSFRSGPGMLTLHVWADDTAGVLLDGNLLMPPVFTQSVCSGQAIGCRPQDAGQISAALLEGPHTLAFTLYQVGTGSDTYSNPFGLLFTGTAPAPADDVPEPSGCALLAGGFLLLAAVRYMRA